MTEENTQAETKEKASTKPGKAKTGKSKVEKKPASEAKTESESPETKTEKPAEPEKHSAPITNKPLLGLGSAVLAIVATIIITAYMLGEELEGIESNNAASQTPAINSAYTPVHGPADRMKQQFEYMNQYDDQQLEALKANQQRQIDMLNARIKQQEEMIKRIEERNQSIFESHKAAVERMKQDRMRMLEGVQIN